MSGFWDDEESTREQIRTLEREYNYARSELLWDRCYDIALKIAAMYDGVGDDEQSVEWMRLASVCSHMSGDAPRSLAAIYSIYSHPSFNRGHPLYLSISAWRAQIVTECEPEDQVCIDVVSELKNAIEATSDSRVDSERLEAKIILAEIQNASPCGLYLEFFHAELRMASSSGADPKFHYLLWAFVEAVEEGHWFVTDEIRSQIGLYESRFGAYDAKLTAVYTALAEALRFPGEATIQRFVEIDDRFAATKWLHSAQLRLLAAFKIGPDEAQTLIRNTSLLSSTKFRANFGGRLAIRQFICDYRVNAVRCAINLNPLILRYYTPDAPAAPNTKEVVRWSNSDQQLFERAERSVRALEIFAARLDRRTLSENSRIRASIYRVALTSAQHRVAPKKLAPEPG